MRAQDLPSLMDMPAVRETPRGTASAPRTHELPQWDGWRHWGHQDPGLYYNGLKHDDSPDPVHAVEKSQHHWSGRGGTVGRDVLMDYASRAEKSGVEYQVTARHELSTCDVEAAAQEQRAELQPADLVIIRSGWTKRYHGAGTETRIAAARDGPAFRGAGRHFPRADLTRGSTLIFWPWPSGERPSMHRRFSRRRVQQHGGSRRLSVVCGSDDLPRGCRARDASDYQDPRSKIQVPALPDGVEKPISATQRVEDLHALA
ncbi:hypothetical protein JHW43_009009 [Diplocarpon mali]|nr:hypothetical protein JHW43_009009 [Diplocarpon mali]